MSGFCPSSANLTVQGRGMVAVTCDGVWEWMTAFWEQVGVQGSRPSGLHSKKTL